ncbi:phosphoglucosamine mutase [Basilea psittacipulmonis DSM 24701]|uniref:Phosphoglucosamine mutase n=2 Tax=Basilea TaxID=1472344 RepID=A0A077DHE9_9BURK|nr:phosphoglucosamine mutase [Basilea psittacipulmonis DSM 24701]
MSRKYFGTDGIRGKVGHSVINPEFALKLGYAAGRILVASGKRPAVLIGKDTRISGYMLESALEAGLSSAGVDVYLAGPIPTPAVAYLTKALRLGMGIVISASHNPYYDNGIKFFSSEGTKLPDELEEAIEAKLEADFECVESEHLGKAYRIDDAAGRYIEFCKSTFPSDLDLSDLTLVVDAANGAAYNIAPHVFRELGAKVHVIACQPDGFNINRGVGALHPENLVKSVKEYGADYGIALDGDADRIQLVDASGRVYNGDELLYAVLKHRRSKSSVTGVVGTLMTNYGLEKAVQSWEIPFIRAKVGDRYVMEELKKHHFLYGGESSGHLLFLDCHSTGDGIIAALQVFRAIVDEQTSLSEWIKDLHMYPQCLINVPLIPGTDWQNNSELNAVKAAIEKELQGKGRVLIRASGTEPIIRYMVEAETKSMAKTAAERLASVQL